MDFLPPYTWRLPPPRGMPTLRGSATQQFNPVAGIGYDVGRLPITDPGQTGDATVDYIHQNPSAGNQFVVPDVRRTTPMPVAAPTQPVSDVARRFRLPGWRWDPYTIRPQSEPRPSTMPIAWSGGSGTGQGMTGVAISPLVTEEHGPISGSELSQLAQIRQPMPNQKRSLLKRFFMIGDKSMGVPGKETDPRNAFDENVIPQLGMILPGDDKYRGSVAAVARMNQFVVPDVRRTFDNPVDAGPDIPRDPSGNPIVDKAGYVLTDTRMEPFPWQVTTTHTLPVFGNRKVYPDFQEADRVRAGAAHYWEDGLFHSPDDRPIWFYSSPTMDTNFMMQNPYGHKGMLKQPLVSRPIFTKVEAGIAGFSAPGGPRYYAPAAGMDAIGAHPNTDRQSPQPWDYNIVDSGTNTAESGIDSYRGNSRRFRLA